jgi:hypothetical protein
VLFKGAEWLMGHYAPQGLRLIADLDIWFPTKEEQTQAIDVFVKEGYRPSSRLDQHDFSKSHHFPPFHRENATARFELHHRLIRASLTEVMDLPAAERSLRREERDGLTYRRLAVRDALAISFLQAGRMASPAFETRKVGIGKWLDFMDRLLDAGIQEIRHADQFGILGELNRVDTQLFTGMNLKFGLPYVGPRDTQYLDEWLEPPSLGFADSLVASFRWENIRSPVAWYRFIRGLPGRIRALKAVNSL